METVLILGAGINGSAIARELVLNGVGVVLVDTADIASGATAYSSRLIHGGLRYLEYGEFALVRESLAERRRLLQLAPQFVHPLELFVPVENRFGGLLSSIGRFFDWRWWPGGKHTGQGRGLWLIAAGLRMYDTYAQDKTLPRHRVERVPADDGIPVDAHKFHWLASYYDAQVTFPERFVIAMLQDARQIAESKGLRFEVLTYHQATLRGKTAEVVSLASGAQATTLEPAAIINATGAWVDETLAKLQIPAARLMGGTKGSHLFTFQAAIAQALAGRGIYAEASDGRPIFILPLAGCTMIGTTDEPFTGDPADAVASGPEIDYLIQSANAILPQIELTHGDVAFHYSGVRPLPHVDSLSTAAVTRRHSLAPHPAAAVPTYSVVGGKLTTCRSLAEDTASQVLAHLNLPHQATSQDRPLPGAAGCPHKLPELHAVWQQLAARFNLPRGSIAALWDLVGAHAESILAAEPGPHELLPDTLLPRAAVRHVIRHEWVRTLDDLVERRLMLLYHQPLTRRCLHSLAEMLVEAGLLAATDVDAGIGTTIERLSKHFGKQVTA